MIKLCKKCDLAEGSRLCVAIHKREGIATVEDLNMIINASDRAAEKMVKFCECGEISNSKYCRAKHSKKDAPTVPKKEAVKKLRQIHNKKKEKIVPKCEHCDDKGYVPDTIYSSWEWCEKCSIYLNQTPEEQDQRMTKAFIEYPALPEGPTKCIPCCDKGYVVNSSISSSTGAHSYSWSYCDNCRRDLSGRSFLEVQDIITRATKEVKELNKKTLPTPKYEDYTAHPVSTMLIYEYTSQIINEDVSVDAMNKMAQEGWRVINMRSKYYASKAYAVKITYERVKK